MDSVTGPKVELSDYEAELARVMAERHPGVAYKVIAHTDIANVGWECDFGAVAVSSEGLEPEIVILGAVDMVGKNLEVALRAKIDEYRRLIGSTEALLQQMIVARIGTKSQFDKIADEVAEEEATWIDDDDDGDGDA